MSEAKYLRCERDRLKLETLRYETFCQWILDEKPSIAEVQERADQLLHTGLSVTVNGLTGALCSRKP